MDEVLPLFRRQNIECFCHLNVNGPAKKSILDPLIYQIHKRDLTPYDWNTNVLHQATHPVINNTLVDVARNGFGDRAHNDFAVFYGVMVGFHETFPRIRQRINHQRTPENRSRYRVYPFFTNIEAASIEYVCALCQS